MGAKQASANAKSHRVFGQARRPPKMFRAGLYARVSTNDQQTIPLQIRALREYAVRRGWIIALQVKEVGSLARSPICPLSISDKLGLYEILAPIGAGGMGEVYRAHDPRLSRDAAIKVSNAQFTEHLAREARTEIHTMSAGQPQALFWAAESNDPYCAARVKTVVYAPTELANIPRAATASVAPSVLNSAVPACPARPG